MTNDSLNRRPQLFCDMDGVLADFDRGYREMVGPYGGKDQDDVDWSKMNSVQEFFLNLPPMPDMQHLWGSIEHLDPIIITGVPSHAYGRAVANKRAWVDKNIGTHVKMIGCKSKDKRLHAKPGDVIIDDWEKYKHLWIEMGGIWVTHTSAEDTLDQLKEYFIFMKRFEPI